MNKIMKVGERGIGSTWREREREKEWRGRKKATLKEG